MCNRQPHPATRRSQPPKPHRLQGGGSSSAIPPLVGAGGRKSPPEKGTKGDAILEKNYERGARDIAVANVIKKDPKNDARGMMETQLSFYFRW